jgi:hypothetical protein
MENILRKSSKIINYLAQSAEPDPGLRYPTNMSWQVQGHFCRIIRHHDSFEKKHGNK